MKTPDFIKEAIIEAHDEGLTIKALIERFNLSRPTITNVLKEAGIELRRRISEETKQEIIAEYQAGKTLRQLEEIYKINRVTINGWVKGLKREAPKKELNDTTREQIYRYYSQGYSLRIIGKTLGVSSELVRRVVDGEL